MGKLYNFTRLIRRYSVEYELISYEEGKYVNGKYVEGEKTITTGKGAIVPYGDSKIYQSGGTLTKKDRQLFSSVEIPEWEKKKLRYGSDLYAIENVTAYKDYADAYIYSLKWTKVGEDDD